MDFRTCYMFFKVYFKFILFSLCCNYYYLLIFLENIFQIFFFFISCVYAAWIICDMSCVGNAILHFKILNKERENYSQNRSRDLLVTWAVCSVTQSQLTAVARGRRQILRSADLHFASFLRIFPRFGVAVRRYSAPTWRASRRASSSCCRPRRGRPRRWPKPANVSKTGGLYARSGPLAC